MKKFFTVLQWLVVALIAAGIVYTYVRPRPEPVYRPETWQSWKGFMVISYAGIARNASEKYPSPSVLLDHLRALRDAGYQPIRPEDAAAFLAGRRPLPDRALLLIFEGGRKDSLIRATPMLQRTGFIGTMAVPTRYFKKWGSAYLKPPDLRAAARVPHWTFARMGHDAVEDIAVDATGMTGRFLTHRRWMEIRSETDEEFRRRITGDYYTSQDLIESATLQTVLAYIYPYGDAGTGPHADPLAAEINRAAVSTRFSIAFVGGDDPFNGPDADPYSLSRLRVPGTWDGRRLVQELKLFEPNTVPVVGFRDPSRWFLQDKAIIQNGHLMIGDQGVAWLRGSDAWSDLESILYAVPQNGARVSLYLRYQGPGSYVRVTLDDQSLRIQERLVNRLLGLASVKLAETDRAVPLRVVLRGRRAWVYSGERAVLGPIPLSRDTAAGRVGIGCEDGTAQITAFEAHPNPSFVVLADRYTALPASLHKVAQTVISPWFRETETPADRLARREDALRAAAEGATVVPLVEGSAAPDTDPEEQVARINTALDHPALQSLIREIAVTGAAPELSRALRQAGFRVLHILDRAEAQSALQNDPDFRDTSRDRFFLDVEGPDAQDIVNNWLRHLPATRFIVWRSVYGDNPPFGIRLAVKPESFATEEQP